MARPNRPGLHTEANLDNGYAALGFVTELSKQISTNRYMSAVMDSAYQEMSTGFNNQVDLAAQSGGPALNHVYEPGMQGNPTARLWKTMMLGRGTTRQITFQWKPSVKNILTPLERAEDPTDPASKLDPQLLAALSEKTYKFRWRAPVMEYNLKVTIYPREEGGRLLIPTMKRNRNKNYIFARDNIPDFSYRNPQDESGGEGTVGQFTSHWAHFWEGPAEKFYLKGVARAVEGDLGLSAKELAKVTAQRRRTKTATISGLSNYDAAMEQGANLARAYIRGKVDSYRRASRYVDRNGYFGGERDR